MPKATVDEDFKKFPLKSAPPDGFIELKQMSYGDVLDREGMALKMTTDMNVPQGNRAQRRSGAKEPDSLSFTLGNREVTLLEFQRCTGEHNLEDRNGNLLDLKSIQGVTQLAPSIGREIGNLLDELNNPPDAEGN